MFGIIESKMIVFGLISPHPPIIIPAIGKEDSLRIQQTIHALDAATEMLSSLRPDKLIIIAPHEGHGFEVPEFYLAKYVPSETQIQEILVTEPSYKYYYDFGIQMGNQIAEDQKRYAIIASGDLSHVLKEDGPYGFNESGPLLDEQIVDGVARNDAAALLNIDPVVLEDGAECGLRSILFLLGTLSKTAFVPEVLSYQGPFGVGYMVATYQATTQPENQ